MPAASPYVACQAGLLMPVRKPGGVEYKGKRTCARSLEAVICRGGRPCGRRSEATQARVREQEIP